MKKKDYIGLAILHVPMLCALYFFPDALLLILYKWFVVLTLVYIASRLMAGQKESCFPEISNRQSLVCILIVIGFFVYSYVSSL